MIPLPQLLLDSCAGHKTRARIWLLGNVKRYSSWTNKIYVAASQLFKPQSRRASRVYDSAQCKARCDRDKDRNGERQEKIKNAIT